MKFSAIFVSLICSVSAFVPQVQFANTQSISVGAVSTVKSALPNTVLYASSDAVSQKKDVAADNSILDIRADADMIFSIVDVDGSGSLDLEELTNHLSTAGYTTDVIQKLFSKMDTDKNGEISRQEFGKAFEMIAALQSAPGLGNYNAKFEKEIYEDADALFSSCDTNNDGSIDFGELLSHLDRKFSKYSENAIKKIFKAIDTDKSGTISKEEVRDAFVRSSAVRQALGEGPNFK